MGWGLPDSYRTTTGLAIFVHGLCQRRALHLLTNNAENVQHFPTYGPIVPQDPRRGHHVLRAALERLQPEAHARVQGEDEALLQAEAGLP
jgi:hypothetical protein